MKHLADGRYVPTELHFHNNSGMHVFVFCRTLAIPGALGYAGAE